MSVNDNHHLISYPYQPIVIKRGCQTELHRGQGIAAVWVELIMATDEIGDKRASDVWFTCADCHVSGLHRARYFASQEEQK